MMKKTPLAKKRENKRLSQARFREKKRAAGMVEVSVWIPASAAEKLQGKRRLGIVVAADGVESSPISFIFTGPGHVTPV